MDNKRNKIAQHAKSLFSLGITILISSCASYTSPIKFSATLPQFTKSKFIQQAQMEQAIENNGCKYLVKGRNYEAPSGFGNTGDIKNAAKGIDEWVTLDGGNAYVLTNFSWKTVNNNGISPLFVEFDTMKCDRL